MKAGALLRLALALLLAFAGEASAQGLGDGWMRDWMRDPRPGKSAEIPAGKPAEKPAEKAPIAPGPDPARAQRLPGNEELLANFSKIAFNAKAETRGRTAV